MTGPSKVPSGIGGGDGPRLSKKTEEQQQRAPAPLDACGRLALPHFGVRAEKERPEQIGLGTLSGNGVRVDLSAQLDQVTFPSRAFLRYRQQFRKPGGAFDLLSQPRAGEVRQL